MKKLLIFLFAFYLTYSFYVVGNNTQDTNSDADPWEDYIAENDYEEPNTDHKETITQQKNKDNDNTNPSKKIADIKKEMISLAKKEKVDIIDFKVENNCMKTTFKSNERDTDKYILGLMAMLLEKYGLLDKYRRISAIENFPTGGTIESTSDSKDFFKYIAYEKNKIDKEIEKLKLEQKKLTEEFQKSTEQANKEISELNENIASLKKQAPIYNELADKLTEAASQYQVKILDVKYKKNAIGVLFDCSKKDTEHFLFGLTAGLIKKAGLLDKIHTIILVDKRKSLELTTQAKNVLDFNRRKMSLKDYMKAITKKKY